MHARILDMTTYLPRESGIFSACSSKGIETNSFNSSAIQANSRINERHIACASYFVDLLPHVFPTLEAFLTVHL